MIQKLLASIPITLAILLTLALAVRLVGPDTAPQPSPMIGKNIPSTTLPLLYDDTKTLSQQNLLNRYTLLNVFASWCAVCVVEHALLMELSKGNLSLIGINWKDPKDNAKQWLKKHGNPYQKIGWDWNGQWVIDLGVTGAPESFLISPEGTILYHYRGPLTQDIIANEIMPLIS
jgi:cytochrome c biogenesis protein CcmG/thiol:disulfide interchange protein DsbE